MLEFFVTGVATANQEKREDDNWTFTKNVGPTCGISTLKSCNFNLNFNDHLHFKMGQHPVYKYSIDIYMRC